MASTVEVRGQLLHDEPMAKHCSWRCGGRAQMYFIPADKQDLALFLSQLQDDVELTWVGLGSNLLVRDGGVRGVVIGALSRLNELLLLDDGRVYAEAGVTCARMARFCQQHNRLAADFLAGIPGTIGGALAMNAGAFGSETWQYVEQVELMDRHGRMSLHGADEFEVAYRHVSLPAEHGFSAGYFGFPLNENGEISRIRPLLQKRNETQPIGLPSCGSVFKNPPGEHAARLIEASGLKGVCIGGACVSDKHANFIINADNASAADIEALIDKLRGTVRKRFNVELQTEVRIIGEAG